MLYYCVAVRYRLIPVVSEMGRIIFRGRMVNVPMDLVLFVFAGLGAVASMMHICDFLDAKRKAAHGERPNRKRKRG
jgi:hypothetical protein